MVLSDNTYPPDIRVKKEAKVLVKDGNKVFLLVKKGKGQFKEEVVEGVHVYRFDRSFLESIVLKSALIGNLLYFFIYRYFILFDIMSLSKKHKVDVLHVHDLPYALATCIAGKLLHKPVVFDRHENYVSMFVATLDRKKLVRGMIFGLLISKMLDFEERICLRLASKIIVVVEEMRKRIMIRDFPPNKVVVVSNTADVDQLKELEGCFVKGERLQRKFVLSYVGGFSRHRGLDTLVMALPHIIKKNSSVHLLLVGDGVMKPILEEMVEKLGVKDYVTFTGWVDFSEAMWYVQMSEIGVIPYHSTPQTNNSMPHKIFQYMYFRKPVVVSDVRSLKRIVEEAECGIVFSAGDHKQLAERVLEAMKDENRLMEMGENGRSAVMRKYNWSIDGAKLIKLYRDLRRYP